MEDDREHRDHTDAHCPVHPESSDDKPRKYRYHRESESIHCSDLTIRLGSTLFGDEDSDDGRERDHADIADHDAEHRHEDKYPEPRTHHIPPSIRREEDEHEKSDTIEKEWHDRWAEHDELLPVVIHEGAEPESGEEIQHQIASPEHSRDKYWVRREVRPEGDREPEEHVRESCYGGVCEDVGEEIRGFHEL